MNSSTRKTGNSFSILFITGAVAAFALAAAISITAGIALAKKGVDVEIPFDGSQLKTPQIKQPVYLQPVGGSSLIVSDAAGGVYSVTMSGATKTIADKTKVPHPGGLAEAPAGFGSYAGQVFVLNAPDGAKGSCEVDRIDKSGTVSVFAKLPDVGANKPTLCRDLEFAPAGAYAGKLYAAVSSSSTIYAIDSSGKATAFGTFDKPLAFDLSAIAFAPSSDSKAPGKMLVGMRPRMTGAAKVGRISVVGPDGKMNSDPYLVGFINPTGFGTSPSGFGTYGDTFMIADMGKPAESGGADDGSVYRVYKDVARPFVGNLADPNCMKFVGNKMVLADPSAKGVGSGAIVVISSML
jgi:hypothetical protein